jgi:hypothetical protein
MIESIKQGYNLAPLNNKNVGYILGKSAKIVTANANIFANAITQIFISIIGVILMFPMKIESKLRGIKSEDTAAFKGYGEIIKPAKIFIETTYKNANPIYKFKEPRIAIYVLEKVVIPFLGDLD